MSIMGNGKIPHRQGQSCHSVGQLLAVAIFLLPLAACTSDGLSDLATYAQEVKARKPGRIPSIPEVKEYQAYVYKKENMRDPFAAAAVQAVMDTSGADGPDMQRNKEPLEVFPMDSLRFVGHMEQQGRVWAVITATDGLVYRVEEGNYVGQNFGRIVGISETQIDVREVVPDGLGGWVERDATLMLAE